MAQLKARMQTGDYEIMRNKDNQKAKYCTTNKSEETWMVWVYTKNGRTWNKQEDNQLDANVIKQAKRKT